jgi:ubiquinol-cytochrome c reductase cytochrome b subunit
MNYSNIIGFILLFIFVLQVLSGLFLSIYYDDFYIIAFDSIIYIIHDVNIGWFIRLYHCLGATLFMFFIFIHLIRGSWIRYKVIKIKINLIWISGYLIFILCLIEGFLGYVPNWGQMSYRGITATINIVSILPILGNLLSEWIWCSSYVIINRIYVFHFLISLFILILLFIHLLLLHNFTSNNPFPNSYSSLLFSLFPLFWKDCFISFVLLGLNLSFFLFFEIEIFGNYDNQNNANPLNTPINILPEWYYLLLYGCLRSIPSKTIGVIIVLIFIILSSSIYLLRSLSFQIT